MSSAHQGRKCSFCGRKAGPKLTMARADSGAVAEEGIELPAP